MFSPDGAFINTSEILSDTEAQAIHNRVQDEVAAENAADGRVGRFKGDPKFAEVKAYTDSEVSKRLPAAISQAEVEARAGQGDEDAADSLNDSDASATQLLEQYKGFVLSKLPVSEEVQSQIRGLFEKYGWPTVWQSLDSIEGCGDGPTWTWQDVDNDLLVRLGDEKLLGMNKIAEYVFIGMRVSQCRDQYNSLTTE
ncbi:uncharacterized protein J4E87_003637 [Alternaria ethzedia]|uniref:uncharacterized protein n=1 Tax=Alternaria ethzedia TaxID=181014 RepID=UPI0020C5A12C|nr:uncharacterized protein J4E87_003637 [Alternaria ethzedia]KAI4629373.1 hypothetical protein J4E87_003637 [Alternaria ethzedia]KAI4714753.1 hypothetical protein J4E89_000434 [Alternaria sp. Ai002NY15]